MTTSKMSASLRMFAVIASVLMLSTACGSGTRALDRGPVESISGLPVSRTSHIFVFDPNDTAALVAFSDDVVVGTVTREIATTYVDGDEASPMTLFEVAVEEGLKGRSAGSVTVGFEGGVTEDGKELVLPEGDSLLEVGKRYLMAGRRMADGTLDLVPKYGSLDLVDGTDAAVDRFRSIASKA